MENQSEFFKSEGGGQFFKLLSETEVKVVSLYDFNPIIERRRLTPTIIAQLKCIPCTKGEFEKAQDEAIALLDLPTLVPTQL